MTAARQARTGVLLALTAAFLWGVHGAVAADVFSEVPPARVAQARALITVAVLVPLAWWRGTLRPRGMAWWLVALGVNLAVVNVTFYWAVDRLGVGPGATIQFLGPFFVLVWMAGVQRRHVGRVAWLAAGVAVIGVGLVTGAWQLEGSDWVGFAAGLLSAVTFASYLLLGEHLGARLPVTNVMTWGFVYASAFWLVVQPLWSFPTDISSKAWLELLFIGVVGTVIPFLAEFAALARVAVSIVGIIATTEPLFGAAAAWVLLDQVLSPTQIVGALMVVGAVASVQRWGIPQHEVPYEAVR